MGKSLKGKELGIGISQRKDGIYQARFTNQLGRRRTIYNKSLSEIRKELRQEQVNDDHDIYTTTRKYTLDQWYEFWVSTFKQNCRNTTIKEYNATYKRISKALGSRYIDEISLMDMQIIFNEMPSDACREFSKKVIYNVFEKAIESNLIINNPARKINTKVDKKQKKEPRVLTKQEEQLILKYSKNNKANNFIVVALGTGMRQGEIRALQKEDIDFQNGCIYVNHTLCYTKENGFELHEPKTYSGKRMIPMTKPVKEALKTQLRIREKIKSDKEYSRYVFVNVKGRPMHSKDVNVLVNNLVGIIKENGYDIKPITPHTFRHTFATRAIEKDINPKVLQKILGHSNINITMNLYCHTNQDTLYEAMQKFN